MADTASDTPPDRLSLDPRSDYFDESLLSRGVGIKLNGKVEPYFENPPSADDQDEGVASEG